MDSFSSTKSWLIKKAGWSKSNKTSKKSKHGKQHIINKSVETNDSSKNVNNIKDNDNACENINEPIVNKEMINHSFVYIDWYNFCVSYLIFCFFMHLIEIIRNNHFWA